jgi:hypothetical protein
MLSIGNLYAHGYGLDRLDGIRSLGYSLRAGSSTYAGSQRLRFVDFADPPALELIRVEDEREYADFIPPGMTPYCPGISVVVDPDSAETFKDYADAFRDWNPYGLHVGYSGGDDPAKPGTNYLNFARPLIEKTFIYLTQYEQPKPARPSPPVHPNGALRATGLVFDLPRETLAPLYSLFGQDPTGDAATLGGVQVFTDNDVTAGLRNREKRFPLLAVVIETGALALKPGSGVRAVRWLGRPALLAEMNPLSWDIILTA